jgi:hypothetical protein
MIDEFARMKWNEKVAVVMGLTGGVIGIIGGIVGMVSAVNYGTIMYSVGGIPIVGLLLMIALVLVWGGCAFLPHPMMRIK